MNLSKSGGTNNPIKYFAYPGETPIFDFYNLKPQQRVTGFNVQCNWVHLKGLEVRGIQQQVTGDCWGVRLQGSNNVVEAMNIHHGQAPGVFITSGANNLILNCDSHENYDPLEGGGNGDGFGCHSSGGGNVIRGCRAWSNSDDGYDFINASGSCTVENSWSWSNGYVPGTMTASGNGAGFKAGGYGSPPNTPAGGAAVHNVNRCLAFRNRAQGFYGNHHPGRINFFNNTAINNSSNFNMTADSGYPSDHVIRNNLATGSGGTISALTGGTATTNSWQVSGLTINASDFVNQMEAEASSPRQADGSLPNIGFMHLVAGSDLIDKGENVGLPFSGSAPDLGAFELGATTTGTGGAGGTTGDRRPRRHDGQRGDDRRGGPRRHDGQRWDDRRGAGRPAPAAAAARRAARGRPARPAAVARRAARGRPARRARRVRRARRAARGRPARRARRVRRAARARRARRATRGPAPAAARGPARRQHGDRHRRQHGFGRRRLRVQHDDRRSRRRAGRGAAARSAGARAGQAASAGRAPATVSGRSDPSPQPSPASRARG